MTTKIKSKTLSYADVERIQSNKGKASANRLAELYNVSTRTVRRVWNDEIVGYDALLEDEEDEDRAVHYVKLSRRNQKQADNLRISRKETRERNRLENVFEDINNEMVTLLDERRDFYPVKTKLHRGKSTRVGVVQLSDLHFGELVKETLDNRFDLEIASKRLRKLIERAKVYFKSQGITNVAVFLTGDMINSSRRISEITAFADARVKVVFNAFLILGAVLEDLYNDFNLSVAQVVGNESRLAEYFDSNDYLANDNFDLMLFMMLKATHEKKGLSFLSHKNPMEQVVNVNGVNFLLVHGNGHKGLAHTNKIETEVEKLKARYATNGARIGYVICGHIHSTYIANNFARSASLVGSNAYAERTLNFSSKASQNLFVVDQDGSIDAIMVDLQKCDGYDGYDYDRESIEYNSEVTDQGTVIIQSVLV